jgi:hypothetical protein
MAKESALAESASTWMQVVFGGLGLSVAIVGLVIAYFAWVQPHSSDDGRTGGDKPAAAALGSTAAPALPATTAAVPATTAAVPATTAAVPATTAAVPATTAAVPATTGATPAAGSKAVPLGRLEATTGGGNVHPAGSDLTMPCATGQTTDRLRTIEYDLSGHYTALTAGLTVTKAHDADTALQVAVFVDDHQIDASNLTKGGAAGRLDVPLTGGSHLRIQLICQLPDGEVRFDAPTLTHA